MKAYCLRFVHLWNKYLSRWLVATHHSLRNTVYARYQIPNRDFSSGQWTLPMFHTESNPMLNQKPFRSIKDETGNQ
jgi:hypothetical protein